MTTTKAMRLASVVTAINVLVASGFSIVGIIHPQYMVRIRSNAGVVDIGDVRGGADNSSSLVRIVGNLQASGACVAAPGCARRRHAIAGCGNRSVSA